VFKLIQLVVTEKRKIEMRKFESELLHTSLMEKPLLLSTIRDPSSTPKINKVPIHSPLSKNKKSQRRERLPTQRGEARNSIRVLTKLTASGAMSVFLHDSVKVLSNPANSGATSEMKTYSLKILSSQAKLPFLILKHYDLAKSFVVFDYVGTG